MLGQQRADRVGDLAPAAVADRDVDLQARLAVGALLGGFQRVRGAGGQQVQRADHLQPPRAGDRGQAVHHVLDDLQQRVQLGRRAGQVVGGQQPQGDHVDAGVPAPGQQVHDAVGAHPVAVVDVLEAGLAGPPAVPVQDHPDVPGHRSAGQLAQQPPLVQRVDDLNGPHERADYARRRYVGPGSWRVVRVAGAAQPFCNQRCLSLAA
jgi:hypothetical protein